MAIAEANHIYFIAWNNRVCVVVSAVPCGRNGPLRLIRPPCESVSRRRRRLVKANGDATELPLIL